MRLELCRAWRSHWGGRSCLTAEMLAVSILLRSHYISTVAKSVTPSSVGRVHTDFAAVLSAPWNCSLYGWHVTSQLPIRMEWHTCKIYHLLYLLFFCFTDSVSYFTMLNQASSSSAFASFSGVPRTSSCWDLSNLTEVMRDWKTRREHVIVGQGMPEEARLGQSIDDSWNAYCLCVRLRLDPLGK